jgi:hypothetical protein
MLDSGYSMLDVKNSEDGRRMTEYREQNFEHRTFNIKDGKKGKSKRERGIH